MTLREQLHDSLARVERKHGPDAPFAQALRRQIAEIERESKSPTEKSWTMSYSAGMRGKSKSTLPSSKNEPASNPPPSEPSTEE
jgi:ribosome modulation factor